MKIRLLVVLSMVCFLGCSGVISASNSESACQTAVGKKHLPDRFEFLCEAKDAQKALFEPTMPKILILGASWCSPCRLVRLWWLEKAQVPVGWKLVFFEDLSRYGEDPDMEYDALAKRFIPKYWEMLPACAVITYEKIGGERYRAVVRAKFSNADGCTRGIFNWVKNHPTGK